jgi:hypothetical protein
VGSFVTADISAAKYAQAAQQLHKKEVNFQVAATADSLTRAACS